MARILHVVNYFDPAADVVRCVKELALYSHHEHRLFVKERHPLQGIYRYEEAECGGWNGGAEKLEALFDWCDAALFQFVGWERGEVDRPKKPAAFRNINIYWKARNDSFWASALYNTLDYGRYKLVASSHVGAMDFLPKERFRWLPDLLPKDGAYGPDFSPRAPCVSYIKHADSLWRETFPAHQNLARTAHAELLARRRTQATVVIDNVCDGHYGLAGQEAVLMGLPTVVFCHAKTVWALDDLCGGYPGPFNYVGPSVEAAASAARKLAELPEREYAAIRQSVLYSAQRCFDPKYLVNRYWDAFFDELLG